LKNLKPCRPDRARVTLSEEK